MGKLRPVAVGSVLLALSGCVGAITPSPLRPAASSKDEPEIGREFECVGVDDPGTAPIRRLSNADYTATVNAALSVSIGDAVGENLPVDLRADGFSNTQSALIVTLEHIEGFERVARIARESIPDFPAFVREHSECTELTETCASSYVRSVFELLVRDGISAEEERALLPIFTLAREEGDGFDVAAGYALEAILQSPRFLYRLEDERDAEMPRSITQVELANRLSYLVWGTRADERLYRAAKNGELSSDEAIESEVRRMLSDPRAREASLRFVDDWLNLTRLARLPRGEELYPDWDPIVLGGAMRDETRRLFEFIVWEEGRPLMDLFDAQVTFASPELAAHYGLGEPVEGTTDRYDLSGIDERGGLWTQGSILTVGGDSSSMVGRGIYLLETFLCGHLADPPPGIDTTVPPIESGRSQRSYSEERVDHPVCGTCHEQMEPIAWGLERFDATGAHQLQDRFGNALGEAGLIHFPGDAAPINYSDVGELLSYVADSPRVRDCVTMSVLQHSLGRPVERVDGCTLASIRERFAESDGTYQELIVAIALSPAMGLVRTEIAELAGEEE